MYNRIVLFTYVRQLSTTIIALSLAIVSSFLFVQIARAQQGQTNQLPIPGDIVGIVFEDINGDGLETEGEPGIPGVTIRLIRDGVVISTTTTNNLGYYSFSDVADDTYTVEEVDPDGYISSTPNIVENQIFADGNAVYVAFGDQQTRSVSGILFDDINGNGKQDPGEPGTEGATVELSSSTVQVQNAQLNLQTTTNQFGIYQFNNLPPGVTTVSIQVTLPSGFTFVTQQEIDLTVSDTTAAFANFAAQRPDTIGGFVFDDYNGDSVRQYFEPGLGSVTIQLRNSTGTALVNTTATNAAGLYRFVDVAPGDYQVREIDPSDYTSVSPNSVNVSLAANSAGSASFADRVARTITGYVFHDNNANGNFDNGDSGLLGVTVSLFNGANALVDSTSSRVGGLYEFTNVTDGNYEVRVSELSADPPSYFDVVATTDSEVGVTISPSDLAKIVHFGFQLLGDLLVLPVIENSPIAR